MRWVVSLASLSLAVAHAGCQSDPGERPVEPAWSVDRQALLNMMTEHEVPGLAVAVSYDGVDRFYNFGVLDREAGRAVAEVAIFEIGSVSMVFTATLAALAEQEGVLSLDAPIGEYMDELAGTPLGDVPVYHLATHTAGGFPLQLPGGIDTEASLFEYYRSWEPEFPAGTRRHYANPSIGLLGLVVARVKGESFRELAEHGLFAQMRLESTFIRVPDEAGDRYAWGHNRRGERVRVNPGLLADEAYGVKTTSRDLLKALRLNLNREVSNRPLGRAVRRTHVGHFDVEHFQQALIWDKFD
ncbi:MAG: serine hydrolase, partial [Planctomycetota bacterium]